jgi:hypothetical protein
MKKYTKAMFKREMKSFMKKYNVDSFAANKMALTNYPEYFDVINDAYLEITIDEMTKEAA